MNAPLVFQGWRIIVWPGFADRWAALRGEVERLRTVDPTGYATKPATKVFAAVRTLIRDEIPRDPGAARFRQGRTLGAGYARWRRAKFFERYRLFFRYDSTAKVIAYVWLNDERTLRARGARSDPYAVFGDMLRAGAPPDDWDALVAACRGWTAEDARDPTSGAPPAA
ncbi:type II toxin-antitoxin system YhaV family toxin [Roseisolibacter agri]|nr:type II toxin-antitoxin system YhaV family toxin [Roseisolibacter agri]